MTYGGVFMKQDGNTASIDFQWSQIFNHYFRDQPDYWNILLRQKQALLSQISLIKDKKSKFNLPEPLAQSWFKSYELGVDPYASLKYIHIDNKTWSQATRASNELIGIAEDYLGYINKIFQIQEGLEYYLEDPHETILILSGRNLPKVSNCVVRPDFSFKSTGTRSYTLAITHKKPFNLIGPEHYSEIFKYSNAFSLPVFDTNQQIIAILTISKKITENEFRNKYMYNQTNMFIFSMAVFIVIAIENMLKLNKTKKMSRTMHSDLENKDAELKRMLNIARCAIESKENGVLVVKDEGIIKMANTRSASILNHERENLVGKDFIGFLQNKSQIHKMIQLGKPFQLLETLLIDNEKKEYYLCGEPIYINKSKETQGSIITIRPKPNIHNENTTSPCRWRFQDIIGKSTSFTKALDQAKAFSKTSENILLIGESGVGKDIFAQAIHNASRPCGPFVAINCAALPRSLLVSELFGYESGSFTGAKSQGHIGKIEQANNGTLFLDEIGDMPLELQATFLRVLEDKAVTRIGGKNYRKIDFRLVAATNQDLEQKVKDKVFREDLLFRLSVLTIKIPPLRDRDNDIELLARKFINKYCDNNSKEKMHISNEAMELIKKYHWPGNIRQLQNVLIYAINLSKDNIITEKYLPDKIRIQCSDPGQKKEPTRLDDIENSIIKKHLEKNRFNVSKTAKEMGISKSTLYRRMKSFMY